MLLVPPPLWRAQQFPTVKDTEVSNAASSSSPSVTMPSGISAGDLLITIIFRSGTSTANGQNGWTELFEVTWDSMINAFYKVADGSEGSTQQPVVYGSANVTAHNTYLISGYQGVPEADTTPSGVGATTTTPDPPSLSPSWGSAKTLWIAAAGQNSTTLISYPTNYTDGLTSGDGRMWSARREIETATEDPGVFTHSTARRPLAATIAVRPA